MLCLLLVLTVLLVLAGLVLLIVGSVDDTLLLIWVGTLCAAVAGVVLIAFSRLSRHRGPRIPIDAAAGDAAIDAAAGAHFAPRRATRRH